MDYGRGDLADALAAEYVIGTLRGGARRRFEALLPAHSELRQATLAWHERLMPLTAAIPPVQPSSEVWRRISDRLERRQDAGSRSPWQRLAFWRGLAAFASVAAISLAILARQSARGGAADRRCPRRDRRRRERRGNGADRRQHQRRRRDARDQTDRSGRGSRRSLARALGGAERRARRARSACCRRTAASSPCAVASSPAPTRSRSPSSRQAARPPARRPGRSSTPGSSRCSETTRRGSDCSLPSPSLREGGRRRRPADAGRLQQRPIRRAQA